jgi:uncharacterized protein YdhG (YjbR/CyaY superfamily)
MSPKKPTKNAAKKAPAASFSAEERAAMKEYARERKAQAAGADDEAMLLAAIAKMPPHDRALAERVHAIVMKAAPSLTPKTWYGMPAWAEDGKVLCFFQSAAKFKSRYATFGFSDKAALDDGNLWATSYALTELTPAVETRIAELVSRAAS